MSGPRTKKDQILVAVKLKPAASCMHRNSPTFHYVKVQQRNVLCLLPTCCSCKPPQILPQLHHSFIYLLYSGSQRRSQQQLWAGHKMLHRHKPHVGGKVKPKRKVVYDTPVTQTITLLSTVLMALNVFPYGRKTFVLI